MLLNSKKTWLTLILVVTSLGLIFGFFYGSKKDYEQVSPKRENITEAIYALGKVKSDLRYEVKVGLITNVKELFVSEGQTVRKGSPLIQFESSSMFRAPFDGVVTKISAFPGEIVAPQVPVLKLENMQKRYIEVALEQQGALRVKPGQKARVDFESIRSKQQEAKVSSIYSREDEFIAHIEITDLDASILPGMTADVVIEIGTKPNALVVPVTSISDGQVTVLRDGKKTKLKLEIGAIDGESAEVISGDLQESDVVLMRKLKTKE